MEKLLQTKQAEEKRIQLALIDSEKNANEFHKIIQNLEVEYRDAKNELKK